MASSIKRLKQNDGRSDCEMFGESSSIDEKKRAAMDSHCEIERRRRNKMVSLVNELSDIVPACNSCDKRKPDKLTILKLAVEHLRALKNSNDTPDELGENKSSFLSDSELKKLVLEATSGFLFVVICATGKVIYVSDTVAEVLGVSKTEWDDANLFNLIHPEDRLLLKKQLKVEDNELQQPHNISQAAGVGETNLPSDLCRRSFIVKMRTGGPQGDKEVVVSDGGLKYVVVHITGCIRHWPGVAEYCPQPPLDSQSCLIAIGHCKQRFSCDESEKTSAPGTTFLARHNTSGIFTFVDNRVSKILGYKSVDLLQRSIFEFCHESDRFIVEEAFQQVLEKKDQVVNITFKVFNSSGILTPLKLSCSAFLNPFSEAVEYISATYTMFAHTCNSTLFSDLDFDMMPGKHSCTPCAKNLQLPEQVPVECHNYSAPFLSNAEPISLPNQAAQYLLNQSHGFNNVSSQSSYNAYSSQINWVSPQVRHKKLDGNSHLEPPDYHQHMNNMHPPVQEPEDYHHHGTDSHIPNQTYHWSSNPHGSSNQMPGSMNPTPRFVDASSFMHGSTSSVAHWNSFDTPSPSHFSYGYTWQNVDSMLHNANGNAAADDMNEMMNILAASSPSTSAMFGAMDESLIKKFCS